MYIHISIFLFGINEISSFLECSLKAPEIHSPEKANQAICGTNASDLLISSIYECNNRLCTELVLLVGAKLIIWILIAIAIIDSLMRRFWLLFNLSHMYLVILNGHIYYQGFIK